MLEIKQIQNGSEYTFVLNGRMDTITAPKFEEALQAVFATAEKIIVDMGNLVYIASAGLRTFLIALKNMKNKENLILVNVQEDVQDVFDITGFSDFLNIQ